MRVSPSRQRGQAIITPLSSNTQGKDASHSYPYRNVFTDMLYHRNDTYDGREFVPLLSCPILHKECWVGQDSPILRRRPPIDHFELPTFNQNSL